jgi:PKD repeat protein
MTTTSNKASSVTKKASAVIKLLLIMAMVAGILFTAPSLSMAQQQQQQQTTTGTATTTSPTTTTAAPTTPPLNPEEQLEQDRLQRTTTAITQNLEQGQKQINGIVYTPRWSEPVWVQPNSLSMLFVYCLPGEYAESGQEILGGSELEVLESYSLAVTTDLTGWLMVVENVHQTDRLPAAVGVICASDANDPEARTLSQQEQVEINNIIRQFITVRNTVINNVTQIINIINNVTRPPPTNNTGGGVGNATDPLRVEIEIESELSEEPVLVVDASVSGGAPPYNCHWDFGDGTTQDETTGSRLCSTSYLYREPGEYTATLTVTDATGQSASRSTGFNIRFPSGNQVIGGTNTEGIPPNIHPPVIYAYYDETVQATSPDGAPFSFEVHAVEYYDGEINRVPVSCDHESGETFPIGETVVTCTAIGTEVEPGQRYTTQEPFTITVVEELPAVADDGVTEQSPTDTVEEVPPAVDGGEEAEPPTNSTGGQ